jgi:stage V sporulation protein G
MEITEVRIKLTADSDDRLQGFCSITFDDCFVVRDLKIIEGTNGPFVAMPSRKLTSHCGKCGSKNHLRASYCNQCGTKLQPEKMSRDQEGRAKLYADIAHPINSACREMIQQHVISEYRNEVELSKQPGYTSRYDDDYDDDYEREEELKESAVDSSLRDVPEKSEVQPATREPRAPHEPQLHQEKQSAPHGDSRVNKQGFGAGIFED